jgi:hypothetical protein
VATRQTKHNFAPQRYLEKTETITITIKQRGSIDDHNQKWAQQVFFTKFRPFFAPAKKTNIPF